ncbi:FtsL-like putative cell division protein [uncultured Planktosalinus sp.]|uniref:FtsL-like putative cell division protein n=1 Tax=uncultured Planktosalinus sp. TaxID=1810935 RepID=UPI0030D9FF30
MRKNIVDILKGKFLINEDAFKNWKFIIFLSLLALIMISSAHSADKKVHKIAQINNEVKELRSEFVAVRSNLMKIKMESKVVNQLEKKGLKPSENPPFKIVIKSKTPQ